MPSTTAPAPRQATHPSGADSHLPIAGLIRRLMAMVYDSLLLLGVAFAYGVLITLLRVTFMGTDELAYVGLPAAWHIANSLLLWLLLSSYFVLCWTKRGQSLGMKTWRLKLETLDGNNPSAAQCWLRCVLVPVSLLPAGLGFIWCWLDRRHGCWHDRWTATRVVVLAKQKNRA